MKKSDFPIFKNYPSLVYLDNAATSQKPQAVITAVKDFYENHNANVHRGIHKLAESATMAYEDSRKIVADFINAKPEEIIFTSGTTESINLIAQMLTLHFEDEHDKKTILLSEMEHHSNILPWQLMAKRLGWEIEYVKLTPDYRLDLEDFEDKLKNNSVSVISLTHMSNVLGTINDIDAMFAKAKKVSPDTYCIIDGAQYIVHEELNLTKSSNIDFYCFSGHKMLGPTGIGVLFGRQFHLEKLNPAKLGGGMISKVERTDSSYAELPEKFEAGTPNIAGAIGLAAACKYLNKIDKTKLENHMRELTRFTLENLQNIPELELFGPKTSENRGPVFSFAIEKIHPHDLAQLLDQDDIAVRAGHHCTQILHREILNIPASSRASLYLYNEKADIDKLVSSLKKIITRFKR